VEGQYYTQSTDQQDYKRGNNIATIGVIFVAWVLMVNFIPKQFSNDPDSISGISNADHAYYILDLSFYTIVSFITGACFFVNKKHWAFGVLRFVAVFSSVWYFSGVLYSIYGIFVTQKELISFVDDTFNEKIGLVFSAGFIFSVIYEGRRWMANKF